MKKGWTCDKVCIEKIIKNIDRIEAAFEHFEIETPEDLIDCDLAQLAITQAITNIHETKKLLRQETLDNIRNFDTIKVAAARNIASHDYDSVNFKIIYDISVRLISEPIKEVLQNEYDNLE